MTALVVIAISLIVVLLVVMRVSARTAGTGSSARTTHDRRCGRDRRRERIRVPYERRRAPRRLEDIAAEYVAQIDRDPREPQRKFMSGPQ